MSGKRKHIIIILAIIAFACQQATAQLDAMFTHYSFNTIAVNPGYAGSRDALSFTALHRSQWVGFDGAPITQTFSAHSPIYTENMGVGLTVVNDIIGPINISSFYGDYAYKLKLSQTGKLALGLKAGFNVIQGNLSTLELDEGNDPSFQNNLKSDLLPNFGFGAYYYTPSWYVGVSAPKLIENDFKSNVGELSGKEQRHYFLIAGAAIKLGSSDGLILKPTTLLKVTEGAPIELDITALIIYNNQIEFGMMYRTQAATGVLVGYNFQKNLRIGYSFDW